MIKIGILGAAGYTGGELIRLLLNHPEAEIVFANSESNAGNPVTDVHEGLYGETDLRFTGELPFDKVDVVFFCFGHGKSEQFLKEHTIPDNVRIIDLAQDFRLAAPHHDFVYGLPEINKEAIANAPAAPEYLTVDAGKMEGTLVKLPLREQIPVQLQEQLVVEYYSR